MAEIVIAFDIGIPKEGVTFRFYQIDSQLRQIYFRNSRRLAEGAFDVRAREISYRFCVSRREEA